MGLEDEQETGQETLVEQHPAGAVHHKTISEMEPLRHLPEDEEDEVETEDEETFKPGPIFGEGM